MADCETAPSIQSDPSISLPSKTSTTIMTINVGYIGSGLSFKVFHFPLTSAIQSYTPSAIFLNSAASREAIHQNESYRALKLYSETDQQLEEMIASVDLVIICSPPSSHAAHMQKCIDAGKHCIVEKPVAGDSVSADKILELSGLAREIGIVTSVFQNRRYDSNFLSLKKIIEDGGLGRIVTIKSRMDRWRPQAKSDHWRADPSQGGLLLDLGSHLVDQMYALFGAPSKVSSIVKSQRSETLEDAAKSSNDYFSMTWSYEDASKPIINIEAGSLVACPHRRFEVHGTKGSWVVEGEDPQEDQIKAGLTPLSEGFGRHTGRATLYIAQSDGSMKATDSSVQDGTWLQYYKDIAENIADPKNSLIKVPISDAVKCLDILTRALQSSQ